LAAIILKNVNSDKFFVYFSASSLVSVPFHFSWSGDGTVSNITCLGGGMHVILAYFE